MGLVKLFTSALLACSIVNALPWTVGEEPEGHEFIAAGPDDSRSPCPWLNALANHAYLPRDGRNVTRELVETAFQATLNFEPGSLELPTAGAISTGKRNDGTFDLEDTVKHNVVEHDGSLSRNDAAVGDALHFNPVIWARTLSHFKEETIRLQDIAAARLDRHATARALNPRFNLTEEGVFASFLNQAVWLVSFGDRVTGDASRLFLRTIFEEERFPFKEGFIRTEKPIVLDEIVAMVGKLQEATVDVGLKQTPELGLCKA